MVLRTITINVLQQWYNGQHMKTGERKQTFTLHSWMASRWNKCTVVSEMDNPSLCPCTSPINMMDPTPSWLSSSNGLHNQGHMQSWSKRRGDILKWNSCPSICLTERVTFCDKCLLLFSLLLAIIIHFTVFTKLSPWSITFQARFYQLCTESYKLYTLVIFFSLL